MRVLLVRAGALGDIVLLRRAVAGLKRAGHGVALLAPAAAASAIRGPGLSAVDDALDWDDAGLVSLFAGNASDLEGLRPRLDGFDAGVAYTGRAEVVRALERLMPRVSAWPPVPQGTHAADWLARPTVSLGGTPPAIPPDLEATDAEQEAASAFLGGRLPPGFVALHPGSGSPAKNWAPARFAALARVLGDEPWLLVEGPADSASAAVLSSTPGAVPARGLTPRSLGVVLSRAGLLVGHDSGVSHLSAAWGVPTLALFGPTDPAVWAPVGRVVRVLRSPTGAMQDLALSDVAGAARELRDAGWDRDRDRP